MINPQPSAVLPAQLNYVKVFTRFTLFTRNLFAPADGVQDQWTLRSDDQEIGDQVDVWVDETKALVIAADTRTDISQPGGDSRIVSQTTSVIYTKAVDNHGRESRTNPDADIGDIVPDIRIFDDNPGVSSASPVTDPASDMVGPAVVDEPSSPVDAQTGTPPTDGPGTDDLPPAA